MPDERDQRGLQDKANASVNSLDDEDDDEDVGSPFDHPAFLPVLLTALAIWFGFDGWFSSTIEAVSFNRYGFFFLLGGAVYFALVEFTSISYLTAMVWGVFALWLGGFSLLGGDESWWRENSTAIAFNQIAAGVCGLLALITGVWEMRRGDAQEGPGA